MLRTVLIVVAFTLNAGPRLFGQQVPEITAAILGGGETEMSASVITYPSPQTGWYGDAVLVGYVSLAPGSSSEEFYSAALSGAVKRTTSTQSAVSAAIGTAIPMVGAGPFAMPATTIAATADHFAAACEQGAGGGFVAAAAGMTQRPTGTQPYWMAVAGTGSLTGLIRWEETGGDPDSGPHSIRQEALARQLLVHQFRAVGKQVSGPDDPAITTLILLSTGRIPLELHLLPLEVAQGSTNTSRPLFKVGRRSISVPFRAFSQGGGVYFRFEHSSGVLWDYPGTPSVRLQFQMAESFETSAAANNIAIVFTGGGQATDVSATVNDFTVACTIPANAMTGPFVVYNTANGEPLSLNAPQGSTSLAAHLTRIHLD